MKLISFTLYGDDPKYTHGLIENLKIKEQEGLYEGWDVIVYHDDTVPSGILDILQYYKVFLRNVENFGIFRASWRFLAHDEPEVERFICRDADSRISKREELAVKQWEDSNKIIHIMRDHPHHATDNTRIFAGMWGMTKCQFNMKNEILKYQQKAYDKYTDDWPKQSDQHFLQYYIYNNYCNKETTLIHAAQDYMDRVHWKNEDWAIDFPTPICQDKYFVGEIFFFQNGIQKRDHQYTER